jgi:hypothetical protein
MSDKETQIIKPRDFAEIIKAPNPDLVADFLEQPLLASIESMTGFLASGPKEWTLAMGRIIQAPLKAKLFQQVAQEINAFRQKGKIPDDFAERKNGAQTWTELFTIIDTESPDQERLEALKAMFFSVNKINNEDAERILEYQLFQIAKKLSSNDLIVLRAAYMNEEVKVRPTNTNFQTWATGIARYIGHSFTGLVELADANLVANLLFTMRNPGGESTITPRVTDFGRKLCDNIKWYHIEKNRIAAGWYGSP